MGDGTKKNQIKIGALCSYARIIINIVTGLIYTPWMIAKIGQSDYALYTLANSIIALFLLDLGLSNAVARFVSKYIVEKREKELPQLIGTITKIYGVMTLILLSIFCIYYFLLEGIYTGLTFEEMYRFKIVYIILASGSILSFITTPLEGIMLANERFIQLQGVMLIQKVLTVLLIAFGLFKGYGLYFLVAVTVVFNILARVYKYIYCKKCISLKISFKDTTFSLLKEIFGYSIWVTVIQFAERFYMTIIPTILGIITNSAQIAIFGIASTIESYGFTFAKAFINMYLPELTRISHSENRKTELTNLMIKVGRIQTYIIGLIVIGFICVGKKFVLLWVGEKFIDAYLCGVLLLVPIFVTRTKGIAAIALQVDNNMKWLGLGYIIGAVINVILTIVLGSVYGALGAAVALCVGELARSIISDFVYQRVLGVDMKAFFIKCYTSMLFPWAITLTSSFFINRYVFTQTRWIIVAAGALIVTVIYCVTMWFFSANKSEKRMITKRFKKINKTTE